MHVQTQGFSGDYPQFYKHPPVTNRSIFSENRTIRQLKPTDLVQNKILLFIQRIFQRMLNWCVPRTRTNYVGIIAALDRTSRGFGQLSNEDALDYFQKFFKSDTASSPSLQQCISQLQTQFQAITALSLVKPHDQKRIDKAKAPLKEWIQKVEQLKEGEQSLIVANAIPGDELFYLFSRKNGETVLKIIGRGASIVHLSAIEEVAVAGQAKIVASLNYGPVDAACIRNLLDHSPLGTKKITDPSLTELLKDRRIPKEDLSHLATKTQNVVNVLWTVLEQVQQEQVQKDAGKTSADFQRTKLRLDLFTLFSLLKEYRHTLISNPVEVQTLGRMLHICSQHLATAYEKELVSKDELQELVKELTFVQQVIDHASQRAKTPIGHLKIASMDIYPYKALTELVPPANIEPPETRLPINLRSHTLTPPNTEGHGIKRLPKKAPADIPIPKRLEQLLNATPQQIVQAIYDMDFAVYKDSYGGELNQKSVWMKFSSEEAEKIMENLNILSQRLVDFSIEEKELPIDVYEVLIKMTYMVTFLNHQILNKGVFSDQSSILMNRVLGHTRSTLFSERSGFIHAGNVRTHQQMDNFCRQRDNFCRQNPNPLANHRSKSLEERQKELNMLSEPIKELIHWQRQVDLLAHVIPHNPANYHQNFRALSAALHGWIAPLPLPLLAVYHLLMIHGGATHISVHTVTRSKNSTSWSHTSFDADNRNTPEAIEHDPESSLRTFEEIFKFAITSTEWRYRVERELENTNNALLSWLHDDEIFLRDSHFDKEARRQQLKALLKSQDEYMLKASQLGINFSKEELTGLLRLLRSAQPQTEVIAFMQTHPSLLSHAAVRSFVQLIFFHPSLLETLNRDYYGTTCQMIPQFFARKIAEYQKIVTEKPSEIPTLLFFLQMSERLKGIYEVLENEMKEKLKKETVKKEGYEYLAEMQRIQNYDQQAFFPVGDTNIHTILQAERAKDPSSKANIEMVADQLKLLLTKPTLSQQELCQIVLDMQRLKAKAHQVSSFDYRELFWIKGRYEKLIEELRDRDPLDQPHVRYLLDTLCYENGLALDESQWVGKFPDFANDQYSVDLVKGTVQDLKSKAMTTTLPNDLLTDSLFTKSFPDLLKVELKAMRHQVGEGKNRITIYFFQDLQKNPCRIEERRGVYSCYRSFPKAGHSELLQSTPFIDEKKPDFDTESLGVCDFIKLLKKEGQSSLPAILQQRLFIDPKAPHKGYIVSPTNAVELEVLLTKTKAGARIQSVVDLRGGKRSEPMQLTGLAAMNHPALKQLEQIEDPAHILIWGKAGGLLTSSSLERIELPRYDLQFTLKNGNLICTDPRYAGYQVNLSASLQERKGFAFSLLLEHPDRTRPKKLLLPPASAIADGVSTEPPSYSGLAYILWLVKSLLAFLFTHSLPRVFVSPHLHLETMSESLTPTLIDLRSHTEEFAYVPGKATEQSQQLILQAIKLGNYELALDVLRPIEIEKEDDVLRKWMGFLCHFKENGYAAAVGLKITEKIFAQIRGQKKHQELCDRLQKLEGDLFKLYLKETKKLTPLLRLSKETFKRHADYLKRNDPNYYQKQIAPFFLKTGDTFTLPVTLTNGQMMTPLPQLLLTAVEENQKEISRIRELEQIIQPAKHLDRNLLIKNLSLSSNLVPLLLNQATLDTYFDPKTKELLSGQALLKKWVQPTLQTLKKEKEQAHNALKELLFRSPNAADQLAIYAKTKQVASFTDLLFALLQKDDFEGLQKQNVLPTGINCDQLKTAVINFYDLEIKFHLLTRCEAELSSMLSQKSKMTPALWIAKSSALFQQISYGRQYDPIENPELLAFEAFHFVTFRSATHPTQLELLQQLLQLIAGIVQAGTGSGKSSVLSVLRGLMRADGRNLVTQKVLPHLLKETIAIFQACLGNTFNRKIYPFLFNQSMPLYDKEGNSLFERIYQNFLEIIQNKGCVLTDYKSFVLLEEKFFALSKQLSGNPNPDKILIKHWFYLAKILLLLENCDDQLMDEFDGPLSAVQRIQTQLKEGSRFEDWMIDESLALFDLLKQEQSLYLVANLQGDISAKDRKESLYRVAQRIAEQKAKEKQVNTRYLYDYLTGQNEEMLKHVTSWSLEEKDRLAFLKEQFTIYLSLTLDRSGISNYMRSQDGKRIVTCAKGDRRDAKFGNPIEEINYSIQDYLQQKVDLSTFRAWVLESKKDWSTNSQTAELRFRDILPEAALINEKFSLSTLVYLEPDDFEDRIKELLILVNENPKTVRWFLKRHLKSLKTSGTVIPMNPQDSVAMSCAVSGVSATTGSLGSLHEQFQKDPEAAEKIQQEMIERVRKRSYGLPIRYDPLNPLSILEKVKDNPQLCAIIDSGPAFRSIPPKVVAEALLKANPKLKKVDFYEKDGTVSSVGDPDASFIEKGFYFPEAQTLGSDQQLRPDGIALMTATEKGDIEEFIQGEGRMRHADQKVLVALSAFASPILQSLDDIIAVKKENKKVKNAEDRYRAELQRLRHLVRHAARHELLHKPLDAIQECLENNAEPQLIQAKLAPFLKRFKELEDLFIQSTSSDYLQAGDYFERHHKLVHRTPDAVGELQKCKDNLLELCALRHILCPKGLKDYDAKVLKSDLPSMVLPLNIAENQQQEVQEELELNTQSHVEAEISQEQESHVSENKVGYYLPRPYQSEKTYAVSKFHKAFDPKIVLTDCYLPLDRTDPLHQRKLFDDRMARIGVIHIIGVRGDSYFDKTSNIVKVVVGDLLEHESISFISLSTLLTENISKDEIMYDIRTNTCLNTNESFVLNHPELPGLIAQIKFLDGMMDGYTENEVKTLKEWLLANGLDNMESLFTTTIIRHRSPTFAHSQLWNIFKSLRK